MYVTITLNKDGRPFEMFATVGKAGGCDAAQHEAIGRLASLAMRSGVDPDAVSKQLRGITCCPVWDDGIQVRSGPDAMALALERATSSYRNGDSSGPIAIETREDATQLGMSLPGTAPAMGGIEAVIVDSPEGRDDSSIDGASRLANFSRKLCPECQQATLAFEEGCQKCYGCGYSKC
jgi:ribonucleoside-diphosphate reductase alpha chain